MGAPATDKDTPQTPAERLETAEQALAKAEAAVGRLRSEFRSIAPQVRAVLEEAAGAGELGRALAEEQLLGLDKRRRELPALVALGEAIAAGAEVALRTLEQEQAREAYAQAAAEQREAEPASGHFVDHGPQAQAQRARSSAQVAAAQRASQGAAQRCEKARQRRAAARAFTLD